MSDRYDLEKTEGTLIYLGVKSPCTVLDISLDGCRIRTTKPFVDGALAWVELDLHLFGMILHIGAITQWVHQERLLGLRFIHPTPRARNELAGLLTCIVDQEATEEIQRALAETPVDPKATRVLAAVKPPAPPEAEPSLPRPTPTMPPTVEVLPPAQELPFDWTAHILFLKDNITQAGTILEIRMEACAVELAGPFRGTHPSQVEIEFILRGLPLRLSGITFPTMDAHVIAIRFDEASPRRQQQLAELVHEILEVQNRQDSAG